MRLLYLSFILLLLTQSVWGVTKTASTGDWSVAGTWSPAGAPGGSDDVIIPAGVTVTLSTNWVFFLNLPTPILNTITVNGTLVLNTAAISLNSIDIVNINTGGQIIDDGFGGLITSGFTPFTSFPIIGPATITGGALPITLLFFEGHPLENGVSLKWASATELNFDHYRIEYSLDGRKFELLTTLKGAGNSENRIDYEFIDQAPRIGTNYYRLVSIDWDGFTEYFNVISVYYQPGKKEIGIYPNPTTPGDDVFIQPNFNFSSDTKIIVRDLVGKTLIDSHFVSNDVIKLSTSDLPAGTYIISFLSTEGGILTEKLVVK